MREKPVAVVLIIAYDPGNLNQQRRRFERMGHQVVTANSFTSGNAIMKAFRYEMVVLMSCIPTSDRDVLVATVSGRQRRSALLYIEAVSSPPPTEIFPSGPERLSA